MIRRYHMPSGAVAVTIRARATDGRPVIRAAVTPFGCSFSFSVPIDRATVAAQLRKARAEGQRIKRGAAW